MTRVILILTTILNQIGAFFSNAGAIANFCTLLLFAIFVVGKTWVLIRNRNLYVENFEYMQADAEEWFNKQFLLGEQDVIKISSPEGIYDIKIYHIEYGKDANVVKRSLITEEKEDGIQHPLKLNKNEAVYIRADLPCGMPNYQVEITKYDYVKITVDLGYNGKVGGLSLVNTKINYGIKSFLYYLCQ